MHGCRGKCRFEKGKSVYKPGYKYCTTCEKTIKSDKLRCHCCNNKYRVGAQANIQRQIRVAITSRRID